MGTTLQDIINPTPFFANYVVNRTAELSAIFQSGIITRDSQFDKLASEPAQVHNMPFFNDLTGDSEDVIEGQDLTAAKSHPIKIRPLQFDVLKCGAPQTWLLN